MYTQIAFVQWLVIIDNYHIGAAQALLQGQFPHIGGFRNTVAAQGSKSLQPFKEYDLQIIHVRMGRTDHWIVVPTTDCAEGEIEIYDSLQLSTLGVFCFVYHRFL